MSLPTHALAAGMRRSRQARQEILARLELQDCHTELLENLLFEAAEWIEVVREAAERADARNGTHLAALLDIRGTNLSRRIFAAITTTQ
jgi:hypothetical protein